MPFPAVGRKRKRSEELSPLEESRAAAVTQQVKNLRDTAKDLLAKAAERFDGDSAQVLSDLREAAPAVRGLMDLVLRFQETPIRPRKPGGGGVGFLRLGAFRGKTSGGALG